MTTPSSIQLTDFVFIHSEQPTTNLSHSNESPNKSETISKVSQEIFDQTSKRADPQTVFYTHVRYNKETQYAGLSFLKNYPRAWQNGKKIVRRTLLKGPIKNTTPYYSDFDRESHLQEIIDAFWFFYYLGAKKNGYLFKKGVIVVEDAPDWSLYSLFENYFTKTNPQLNGTNDKPVLISYNLYSCARHSTHFLSSQKEFPQYGIDARIQHLKIECYLPHGHGTLLIGRISHGEKTLFFLKPERVGVAYKEAVSHSWGVVESLARKQVDKIANLSEKLGETLRPIFGSESDPSSHRETVPEDLVKKFSAIVLNHPEFGISQPQELIKAFKEYGMQLAHALCKKVERIEELPFHLRDAIQKAIEKPPVDTSLNNLFFGIFNSSKNNSKDPEESSVKFSFPHTEFQQFCTDAQKIYGFDHLDCRKGKEIILSLQEIISDKGTPDDL